MANLVALEHAKTIESEAMEKSQEASQAAVLANNLVDKLSEKLSEVRLQAEMDVIRDEKKDLQRKLDKLGKQMAEQTFQYNFLVQRQDKIRARLERENTQLKKSLDHFRRAFDIEFHVQDHASDQLTSCSSQVLETFKCLIQHNDMYHGVYAFPNSEFYKNCKAGRNIDILESQQVIELFRPQWS